MLNERPEVTKPGIAEREIENIARTIDEAIERVGGSVETAGEIAHRLLGSGFNSEDEETAPPQAGGRVGDAIEGLRVLHLRLSDLEARLAELQRL